MAKENYTELRQIADGATRHINALQALKLPTSSWDALLIHVLSKKLDPVTLRDWKSSLTTSELPTFKQFLDFIARQCDMLESTPGKSNVIDITNSKNINPRLQTNRKRQTTCTATVKIKCTFCQGKHSVYHCKDFLALAIPQRIAQVRKHKICTSCLRSTAHLSSKCPSGNCRICELKHNTLLPCN